MKLIIIGVGKEKGSSISEGISYFKEKLSRQIKVETIYLPHEVNKEKEGESILGKIKDDDFVVLLDENGKEFTSKGLADFLEKRMIASTKRLIFIIGGAYGVSDKVLRRANFVWKLSNLTLPHQLVGVIVFEALYRAFTILNNEKYHHG